MTSHTIPRLEAPMSPPATRPGATERDARFWDRLSTKYARSAIADMAGYERTLARTADHLRPSDRVLEVGCGTGTTALRLAPGVAAMVATDLSPAMVEIARGKAGDQGIDTVHFVAAAADDTRFAGEGFDAVLAFNLLHLVPDVGAALAAIAASVKPGGLLISKTPCIGEMNPLIGRVMIPVMGLVGKAPSTVHAFRFGDLERALERAGFDIVLAERHATRGRDTRPFLVAARR